MAQRPPGRPAAPRYQPAAIGLLPQPRGANRGRTLDLDCMVRSYWAASDWDPDSGMPTPETLAELDLEELLPL